MEARVNQVFGGDAATAIADSYIGAIQQAYAYAALLSYCFPFAVLLMWLHRLSGECFRLGETMVFSLYCFGHTLMITACLIPITVRINSNVQLVAGIGTYFLFAWHAHTGFFRRTWWARLMTGIATGISTGMFFVSILVIFTVSTVLVAVFALS